MALLWGCYGAAVAAVALLWHLYCAELLRRLVQRRPNKIVPVQEGGEGRREGGGGGGEAAVPLCCCLLTYPKHTSARLRECSRILPFWASSLQAIWFVCKRDKVSSEILKIW